MATLFDIGLLENFSPIFTFLFIFVAVFGILEVVKIFGEGNKNLNAIIALCIAVFITFADKPRIIIQGMIPWFVLMFIFGMFLIISMRFTFGSGGDEMLLSMLGGKPGAGWWIGGVSIAILVILLGSVIGPEVTPGVENSTIVTSEGSTTSIGTTAGSTATGDWKSNVLNTIYHPKVLGAVMLLFIALFAIKLISTVPKT